MPVGPHNISFLSASRSGRKPDAGGGATGPFTKGFSKIRSEEEPILLSNAHYIENSTALPQYGAWIHGAPTGEGEATAQLLIPFTAANNGNVFLIGSNADPITSTEPLPLQDIPEPVPNPMPNGASTFAFALENAGSTDCHTNQYESQFEFLVSQHDHDVFNTTYLDDLIWEVSIYARVIDSDFQKAPPRRGFPKRITDFTFDTDNSEGNVNCELYLFGVNASHTPFFDGQSALTITSGSASAGHKVDNPEGYGTYYRFDKPDVNGLQWHLLRMYVKFVNTNITGLTMRVDVDTPNKTVVFALPRLHPHNLSLAKIMGGTGISDNFNFKFSDYLG